MRTFDKVCAQGDVYIRRCDKLPDHVVRVATENGVVKVAHSETGHDHVMDGGVVTMYRPPKDSPQYDWDAWLEVAETTSLDHLRPHDTHESIQFEPGVYHVRRQREFVPEGYRRVED